MNKKLVIVALALLPSLAFAHPGHDAADFAPRLRIHSPASIIC